MRQPMPPSSTPVPRTVWISAEHSLTADKRWTNDKETTMAVNSVRCWMVIGLLAVNTAGYAAERTLRSATGPDAGSRRRSSAMRCRRRGRRSCGWLAPTASRCRSRSRPAGRDRGSCCSPPICPGMRPLPTRSAIGASRGRRRPAPKPKARPSFCSTRCSRSVYRRPQERTGAAVEDLPPPMLAFQYAGGPWHGAGRCWARPRPKRFA